MKVLKIRTTDSENVPVETELTEDEIMFLIEYAINSIMRKEVDYIADTIKE